MPEEKYRLSFTTGGLFSQESALVAEIYLRTQDWLLTRDQVRTENLLQVRTASAALRISKEIVSRLELLTIPELECIVDGSIRERSYLLWSATCRRYDFIRDFAVEVLREYFVSLRQELHLKDFDAFFNGKALWHEELDNTAPSTQNKLRQNLFRMLREADLISAQHVIQPAMLTPRIASLLAKQGREAFLIYPLSDTDINKWLHES
jgi:malonyl CoA-acyl carrier protein transacylase